MCEGKTGDWWLSLMLFCSGCRGQELDVRPDGDSGEEFPGADVGP